MLDVIVVDVVDPTGLIVRGQTSLSCQQVHVNSDLVTHFIIIVITVTLVRPLLNTLSANI